MQILDAVDPQGKTKQIHIYKVFGTYTIKPLPTRVKRYIPINDILKSV
jgi:hypothetical protein